MENREIKFRAFNGIKIRDNISLNDGNPVRYGYQWFNTGNDVYHSKPLQYTGLNDKYGTEIFEGDIVMHLNNFKYEVIFKYGAFGYMSNLLEDDFISYSQNWLNLKGSTDLMKLNEVEVIGNIYENPELLKK